jgi:hypothetical protein
MTHSLSRVAALALAPIAALALAGCNLASLNATIASDASASLQTICSLGVSANIAFSAIAATGKLSKAATSDEAAAYASLQSLCANPPTNVTTALGKAAAVYSTIAKALSAAKAAR